MGVIQDIEKLHPLTLNHEEDCRDVWPKRWKAIKSIIEVVSAPQHVGLKGYNVEVTVKANTLSLHPVDEECNPCGSYKYMLEAQDEDSAKERALDSFHNTIPIKVLEDFDITATIR